MELGLKGKSVVVTGASKGIGKGVARRFFSEGCIVHMVSRSLENLEAAAKDMAGDDPSRVRLHAKDISESGSADDLLELIGAPDILVNNAGAIPAGDLKAIDEARWREAWDLKVFGYINMTRAFLTAMESRGEGVIVNVTGLAADRTDAGYVAGTTGNAGLNAFTRAVGSRSLSKGVRVLAVSPGPVETERLVTLMRTRAEAEFGDPERWREYLANLPAGRAASVEEVADVVVFLASARAGFVSGTVVTVDGGHGANQG
ncbi:MAG: short-chain dehydrogenase/reductase, partial [Gammaproteobacteria bacterium]|nr:short-chain dehydrogenase/reductase [Gammaproteobacteria bacterium]